MFKKDFGKIGEKIAEKYLKDRGYKILARNFIFRLPGNPQKGELDIVARKEDVISFVEVKTLKNAGQISPEEKVNPSKQRKLRMAAESWLMKNKIPLNSKWQIDVIAIEKSYKGTKISHFENAFPYS